MRDLSDPMTFDTSVRSRLHPATRLGLVLALLGPWSLPALEARSALVGDPVEPFGSLSGKIVYLHAGHGWTAANLGSGSWDTQRSETFEIVEDLHNLDALTLLADLLWSAGATVVPLRPVGHQPHEVVLDNDDPEVSFTGTWTDASSSVYFGDLADVPYREATASVSESAYARYRPSLPAEGFYPVYCWAEPGADRVSQLYRIHHSGGETEIRIDHRRVGNGLVYLGTFHFDAGTAGYVDVSNRSDETGVVVADMIRFGNGMGDINRGGGVSGQPREDEAALYWIQWHVDRAQGIPDSEYRVVSSDSSASVSAPPRWAEFMNREADGALSDRVYVSLHSNGGGGASRGVLGLYNGNNDPDTATPNQELLAELLAREINDDLVAQNGTFEHDWSDRTVVTLDNSAIELGEINNLRIGDEFDATILEMAFRDNQLDAELLRDPRVLSAFARALHQGLVRYFHAVDGGTTPLTFLPGPVRRLRAISNADQSVTVSWTTPLSDGIVTDAPTGFRVYSSTDGKGFALAAVVAGGGTTSHTLDGFGLPSGPRYFRVAPTNAAGEWTDPFVVTATPLDTESRALIVNGYNRLDRAINPWLPYFGGLVDRVRPRHSNARDYVVQVAEAIAAFDPGLGFDSSGNSSLIEGDLALSDYDLVLWILGLESSQDSTLDATEQALLATYLAAGGKLFISGAEIGWDLDALDNGRVFYNDSLRAGYVSDDANTYSVAGVGGSIFDGLSFSFDDGTVFYDTRFPDVIEPLADSASALSYVGGTGGTAAIEHLGGDGSGDLVMLAFPFETIVGDDDRDDVMAAVLAYMAVGPYVFADGFESGDAAAWSSAQPGSGP